MNLDARILVTGVKGQLGFDCMRELTLRGYKNIKGIDIDDLDLTKEEDVYSYVRNYNPDCIMHNAAYTAVDKAENNIEAVRKINVLATRYLTNVARELKAKMIYISTDYVFKGDGDKYFEVDDEKKPQSVYGLTKYEGELEAIKNPKHFIIRISWVFGKNGNNFIKTMLRLSETKSELNVVNDQIGSPTYTYDLSSLMCDMMETNKYGIYHATNEGICSWAEFAQKIMELANRKMIVKPITTQEYQKLVPSQAIRPLNSRMSKKSLDDNGFKRLPSWEDALERYLKEIEVI